MSGTVTVYSTPLCAPCERLKQYLSAKGVPFRVRDLLMDEDAADFLESRNVRSAPALQVGETLLAGPALTPERIDAALGL